MRTYNRGLLANRDDVLFLHGGCHVFALALRARYRYCLRVFRKVGLRPPAGAAHVFCAYDTSHGIDVMGYVAEAELRKANNWGERYKIEDITEGGLLAFTTEGAGPGLYLEASFVKHATIRANCLIDRYDEHYSGRNKSPVPGFHRNEAGDVEDIFA